MVEDGGGLPTRVQRQTGLKQSFECLGAGDLGPGELGHAARVAKRESGFIDMA